MSDKFPALAASSSSEEQDPLALLYSYLPLDGSAAMEGDLRMGGLGISSVRTIDLWARSSNDESPSGLRFAHKNTHRDVWIEVSHESGSTTNDEGNVSIYADQVRFFPVNVGTTTEATLCFGSDFNTGIYSNVADTLNLSAGGVEMLRLTEATTDQILLGVAGTATVPALTWISDTDTGLSNTSADVLDLVAGGVQMLSLIESTNDQIALGPVGSTTVPALTAVGDLNTGWSWHTADTMGAIIGGTEALTIDATTKMSGAWTDYAVAWTSSGTQPAIGNGVLIGSYSKIGRTVNLKIRIKMGSTTTYGTGYYSFSLPVTAAAAYNDATSGGEIGSAFFLDTGVAWRDGFSVIQTTTTLACYHVSVGQVSATGPHTWGNTDEWNMSITYESAA